MDYKNGPDQIVPSESLTTCSIDGYVKMRNNNHSFSKKIKPQSIPGVLHKVASEFPNEIALITTKGRGGAFKTYTYEDYEMNVRFCAKAFLKLGLKRHCAVCIMGFNSPEWFFSALGAIYAGGVATGIYISNSAEACFHIAHMSKANIIVVEEDQHLQKILSIRNRLPELKAIIQYSDEIKHPEVMAWNDFIELGSEQPDDELENVLKTIAINECCSLIFTSGTVGYPKGVMVSHDNLLFSAYGAAERGKFIVANETIISYLPLSHIAAQLVDIYICLVYGLTTFFADKKALQGTLIKTLQLAKPTRFLGVPRVWEKIYENMKQIGEQNGYLKKQIAAWAKQKSLQYNMNKINGIPDNSWGYYFANKLVLKRIKSALGFDRCVTFVSAAAPLSPEVKKYFLSLDIPVTEAFGMSEVMAHTLATPETLDFTSLGTALSGMETKIAPIEGEEYGEICLYGRHVFMGYLNDPEKTKETIDEEGWFHSGDIGTIDDNGKLYITGRLKELLITAGGENIAPVPIEQQIKKEMPFVSNAVLIGDKHKFLSLLITLKTDVDENTQIPKDTLTKDVEQWLRDLGSEATTVPEVLDEGPHPKVKAVIQKAIDKVNVNAISNAQRIQKYAILPKDFSLSEGDLGPTLKLKRHVITKKYEDVINEFYS